MRVDQVRAWKIFYLVFLVVVVLLQFADLRIVREISLIALVLSVAADVVITLLFWRCPHCRKMLPKRFLIGMDYCPRCGQSL